MKTKKLFKWSSFSFTVITPVLLASLLAVGVHYNYSVGKRKALFGVRDGVQTCFSRVTQSFTAYMIGGGNTAYLNPEFFRTTGDCFGEAIQAVNTKFKTTLNTVSRKLNDISNDVHWFHGRLTEKSGGDISSVTNRYVRLDQGVTTVTDTLDLSMSNVNRKITYTSWTALGIFSSLLLVFGLEIYARRRRYLDKISLEAEAETELRAKRMVGDVLVSSKVEDILTRSLETEGLFKCSELLTRYHSEIIDSRIDTFMAGGERPGVMVAENIAPQVEVVPEKKDVVNLNMIFNDVFDMLADSIFAHGVMVDNDIDENIFVKANSEALQQVIFNLLANALESSIKQDESNRRINVRTKLSGNLILFKINDSGPALDGKVVRKINGENNDANIGLKMAICLEFIDEFNGEIACKYRRSDDGKILGNIIELQLDRAEVSRKYYPELFADSARAETDEVAAREIEVVRESHANKGKLVSVVKGTKREVLAAMKDNA